MRALFQVDLLLVGSYQFYFYFYLFFIFCCDGRFE